MDSLTNGARCEQGARRGSHDDPTSSAPPGVGASPNGHGSPLLQGVGPHFFTPDQLADLGRAGTDRELALRWGKPTTAVAAARRALGRSSFRDWTAARRQAALLLALDRGRNMDECCMAAGVDESRVRELARRWGMPLPPPKHTYRPRVIPEL